MRKLGIGSLDKTSSKAVSYLNKLLDAADTAQEQGKYLALNKVLKEAKRLSQHIRENQSNPFKDARPSKFMGRNTLHAEDHKKSLAELQWLKISGAQKAAQFNVNNYKKVIGEIVD